MVTVLSDNENVTVEISIIVMLCFHYSDYSMELITFVILAAGILHVSICSKLALITGLNGGLVGGLNPGLAIAGINPGLAVAGVNPGLAVAGINPGLAVAGINPGLAVAGLNTALYNGGGLIAQPQFAQVLPGVPTYLQPRAVFPGFGFPQQQQFPRQGVLPANGRLPYYMGVPPNTLGAQQGVNPTQQQVTSYYMGAQAQNTFRAQQGVNPGQQQVMGTTGNAGDVNQQQGDAPAGPIKRYRRSFPRKVCVETENEDPSEIASTPMPTDAEPIPKLIKME
ncbi:hypothetical protein AAFF_G00358620 [Aldrovandia affinis]|uniref:Uncharacterized protein n=1 Tax=Aldrovandia affinis TaxID=143900 RepID=A0AAD7T8X4_9TELE|nr:hypothetical protein AAFF_G00358620 [Aldrovandia affinis]